MSMSNSNPANEARRSSPQTTNMVAIAHPSLKRPTTSDLEKRAFGRKNQRETSTVKEAGTQRSRNGCTARIREG
ncbi:hypothetical protein BDW42DRAFT_158913 [Aspergillus taichungensis]|uniref:Uncharacterized protein n=1 Tax=Aspergillus taichungensis TaxID=482145 RepID=A0A2J5I8C4_9EURO|nr:hypothetical protein BDW42DRAFT_158913 [Aspergillus taichungensis]